MKRWNELHAIAALIEEAHRLGRTPKADDLRRSEQRCPTPVTYVRLFGSLSNYQRQAGFAPTRSGGQGRYPRP